MILSAATAENSVAIERGPLVYVLKVKEDWQYNEFSGNDKRNFGPGHWSVSTENPWNYGLKNFNRNEPGDAVTVAIDPEKQNAAYPWNPENVPIELKVKTKRIPYWNPYNDDAAPPPYSPAYWNGQNETPEEEITLIPYGCTTLRISQFPRLGR